MDRNDLCNKIDILQLWDRILRLNVDIDCVDRQEWKEIAAMIYWKTLQIRNTDIQDWSNIYEAPAELNRLFISNQHLFKMDVNEQSSSVHYLL